MASKSHERVSNWLKKPDNIKALDMATRVFKISVAQAYIMIRIMQHFEGGKGHLSIKYIAEGKVDPYMAEWVGRVVHRKYFTSDSSTLRVWKKVEHDALLYWGWD